MPRVYVDNAQNRRLGRVGEPIKPRAKKGGKQGKNDKKPDGKDAAKKGKATSAKQATKYKSPEFVPSDWDLTDEELHSEYVQVSEN